MRKYEYYNSGDNADRDIYGTNWSGQTFTPELTHLISKVKLKFFRVGDPGTITISIKNTSASKPTGADLCSNTLDSSVITLDTNGEWYEITLGSGAELTKGTQYAIVVRAPSGDVSNKLSWRTDATTPTYAYGTYCGSSDSGVDWSTYSGSDAMFEEWGTGPPSPTTICWGNLLKSQISTEKIEAAILRMIQDHEDDANAHLETGESLQSHKASEIIDHAVGSIVSNIIGNQEVPIEKLYQNKFFLHFIFESLDGWDSSIVGSGAGVGISPGVVFIWPGSTVGDLTKIWFNGASYNILGNKNPWFQCLYYTGNNPEKADSAILMGSQDYDETGEANFGFRWDSVNSKFYAFSHGGSYPGSPETKTEIVGIGPVNRPIVRAEFTWISSNNGTIKFYVNEILKATHTNVDFDSTALCTFSASIKTTVGTPASDLYIRDLYISQNW